jgi:hypothetical protein
VLLITNSEHGQANVFLATSYALLTLNDDDVEVHFASFPPIEKFVSVTTQHAVRDSSTARPIIFHPIDGIDMVSAWTRPELVSEQEGLKVIDVVKLIYAIRRMMLLLKITLPWTGPEFVQILFSVIDIVHKVQPDVIAVDPAFSPALTALRHIRAKFVVLSPNTIKDFAMPHQPNGEPLWKYPWYVSLPFTIFTSPPCQKNSWLTLALPASAPTSPSPFPSSTFPPTSFLSSSLSSSPPSSTLTDAPFSATSHFTSPERALPPLTILVSTPTSASASSSPISPQ